jgi:hypothetical protein
MSDILDYVDAVRQLDSVFGIQTNINVNISDPREPLRRSPQEPLLPRGSLIRSPLSQPLLRAGLESGSAGGGTASGTDGSIR